MMTSITVCNSVVGLLSYYMEVWEHFHGYNANVKEPSLKDTSLKQAYK